MTKEKEEILTAPKAVVEVAVVLDRSGSMGSVLDSTIDAFNELLSGQRADNPDALLTLVQFDDHYEVVTEGTPVADTAPLDRKTYVPRGMTALHDAIGRTVARMRERGVESAVLAVITDGLENASTEYTAERVREEVERAKADGWHVVFMGANQDAALTASTYGIDATRAMTISASDAGMHTAARSVSRMATTYSLAGGAGAMGTPGVDGDLAFTDAERSAATDEPTED